MSQQHHEYDDGGDRGELDRLLERLQALAHGQVDERPRGHHRPVDVPLDPAPHADVRRYVERVLEPAKL